jgi:transposase
MRRLREQWTPEEDGRLRVLTARGASDLRAAAAALGNPLALSLTGGHTHDITQADTLVAQVEPKALLGDKGYDADSLINSLEVRAIKANGTATSHSMPSEISSSDSSIPSSSIGGIATRYEKTARNFLAGLHLVCALAWLK